MQFAFQYLMPGRAANLSFQQSTLNLALEHFANLSSCTGAKKGEEIFKTKVCPKEGEHEVRKNSLA